MHKNHHIHPHQAQTEAHRLIIDAHAKTGPFLTAGRLHELSVLLQSLEQRIKNYYKFTSVHSEDLNAIRSINKLRKRNQIIILHNRAVLSQRQGHLDRAIDLRTIILQELGSLAEGEQIRYGFLEEKEQEQRAAALNVIAFWKREMVRHYYFLALEAYHHYNIEISLAALMKGLDLIRESYQRELHWAGDQLEHGRTKGKDNQNQSYSSQLCHFEQVQELFLLWQLRERVGHSKYLNIVSSNTLTEVAASLARDVNPIGQNPPEFAMLEDGKLLDLDLPLIEEVIDGTYQGPAAIDQFEVNRIAHFLYLGLLGKVYSQQNRQTQSQYLKLKNAKNVVFLHVLKALFAKNYLSNCIHIKEVLQEIQSLYKPKLNHQKQTQNIYSLIEMFGLTPQSLSEHSQSQQEVSIIHMNAKQKKALKKVKSNSKPKSKSKTKGKPKGDKKPIHQKQKKIRVKEEYMLKRDCKAGGKPSENHLLKAINQNYRSFDSSRSKDKQNSPFRRAFRTETCIQDHNKHKNEEKTKITTVQIHKKFH